MSESQSGYLTPDEVTKASFETKRRGGLDPEAVSRHLASVAATVHGLTAERDALKEQLESLKEGASESPPSVATIDELDEEELTERLGHDAARVLAEARAAAADRIAEAEEEADAIRGSAEEIYAARSQTADEEAARIREAAEALLEEHKVAAEQAGAEIVASAQAEADQVRSTGVVSRESADLEAERIVREAELTRRQILEDLARRRSAARRQIEQLRAGRERLLASHETVRRALDDITEELSISMSEARAAAETAGHTVSDTTIEELEAEIETARLTGLLDTGPVPVVSAEPEPASPSITDKPDRGSASKTSVDTDPSTGDADPAASEDNAAADSKAEADAEDSTAHSDADEDATADAAEAPAAESSAALADVVQLDRARNDVDTATHPAKGRDAGPRTSPALPTANRPESTSTSTSKVTKLESVKPAKTEPEADDSVDDLFANLRSTTPAVKDPAPKKTSAKKTSAKKKSPTKKSGTKKKSAKKETEPTVDSSELARRLKRVLADEQSRVMSTLKSSDETPGLDALLGTQAEHGDSYWNEVLGQLDNASNAPESARAPISDLVDTIRRRVESALEGADDDRDASLSALRSVYREVKTQQVGTCAHDVCLATAGVSAN